MENATSSQRVLPIVIGVSSIGAVFVYLIMKIAWGRQYKLPPGPWALPIVGNLPQLHGRHGFYYKVLEFRQTYGDIFRLQMGVHNIMFVFGHQYVQELLCKNGDLVTKRPNWMYVPDKLLDKKGKNHPLVDVECKLIFTLKRWHNQQQQKRKKRKPQFPIRQVSVNLYFCRQ